MAVQGGHVIVTKPPKSGTKTAMEDCAYGTGFLSVRYNLPNGRVVKLAATADSKSAEGNLMSVRVRPRPPSAASLLSASPAKLTPVPAPQVRRTPARIQYECGERKLASDSMSGEFVTAPAVPYLGTTHSQTACCYPSSRKLIIYDGSGLWGSGNACSHGEVDVLSLGDFTSLLTVTGEGHVSGKCRSYVIVDLSDQTG